MSTAHRPQADGATERANRTIQEVLRHFVNPEGTDWDAPTVLPAAEFAINAAHRVGTTGRSAFEVATGLSPKAPLQVLADTPSSAVAEALTDRLRRATDALQAAKEKQADVLAKATPPHQVPLAVGTLVLLSTKNYPQFRASKLSAKYIGPFKIVKLIGAAATLDLPTRFRIHKTINIEALRVYDAAASAEFPGRIAPRPAPLTDSRGHPLFHMHKFLAARRHRGKPQILVRWEGYGPESDSWEPRSAVQRDKQLMDDFLLRHPAPRRSQRGRGGGGV